MMLFQFSQSTDCNYYNFNRINFNRNTPFFSGMEYFIQKRGEEK